MRVEIVDRPKSDPDVLYIGLNDRDKAWHDLYRLRISTGERTLVRTNTARVTRWVFDRQGRLRLATRSTEKGATEVLRVDSAGFVPVYTASVFEQAMPIRFAPDTRRVYMETNTGDADLTRLVLFDPATKQETLVESDPKGRVDFGDAIFSERTGSLVGSAYADERTRVYGRDSSFARDYRLLERLATTRAITYKSSDGLEIPAFLTLPKGIAARNLPLIAFPHGGPWARDYWGFNSFAQFLANRGYAVLQPNFRGSTGYGKRFLNAGNRE